MTVRSSGQRGAHGFRSGLSRWPLHSAAILGAIAMTGAMTSAMAIALAPSHASADVIFSAGAGGVVPWEGSGQYSVMGSVGFNPFTDYTRLALEFEYRKQDTAVNLISSGFGIIELPMDTYDLRAVFRLVLFPGRFTPYVGIGGGFKLIAVDDRGLKYAIGLPPSIAATKSYGVAGGLLGLVGAELPLLGESLSLFVEARADYNWELTDGASASIENGNLGAFVGMGGLRFSY